MVAPNDFLLCLMVQGYKKIIPETKIECTSVIYHYELITELNLILYEGAKRVIDKLSVQIRITNKNKELDGN